MLQVTYVNSVSQFATKVTHFVEFPATPRHWDLPHTLPPNEKPLPCESFQLFEVEKICSVGQDYWSLDLPKYCYYVVFLADGLERTLCQLVKKVQRGEFEFSLWHIPH